MKIAAAQTNPENKSINQNINDHILAIEQAAKKGVQLITFPEMSLTGYQRDDAMRVAFTEQDQRLSPLKKLAAQHQIIIIAGAPVLLNSSLHIASFILLPNGTEQIYTKQYLHTGEEIAFSPSFLYNPTLRLSEKQIALAICADITHAAHPAKASETNCQIYLPSIFYTPNGINEAYEQLSTYAKRYKMDILMSNFCGASYGFNAAGKSAFWNNKGQCLGELNSTQSGLLIAEQISNNWVVEKRYF